MEKEKWGGKMDLLMMDIGKMIWGKIINLKKKKKFKI
jgi:hypothetical protein